MSTPRFALFGQAELDAISDGLEAEADLDPDEDPSFGPRVEIARRLLDEINDLGEPV